MSSEMNEARRSYPLTPEQRAAMAAWGGSASASHATHAMSVVIGNDVTMTDLELALDVALREHKILQFCIRQVPGYRALRLVQAHENRQVKWVRLSGDTDIADFLSAPMEVQSGELLRAAVISDSGHPRKLVFAMSAIAADRGSMIAFVESLTAALRNGSPREGTFQYLQYMDWRQELNTDPSASAASVYWTDYMQRMEAWARPRLVYRAAGDHFPSLRRIRVSRSVDLALVRQLVEASASAALSTEIYLQTVWWLLLARLNSFRAFAGGWQHDCRTDYDLMRGAVGVFDKVLPVVVDGHGDEPFSSWLSRMASQAHAHIEAQEQCPIESLSGGQHLAVGFAFELPLSEPVPGWKVEQLSGPMPCFELALCIESEPGKFVLALYASPLLYSLQSLEVLLAQYDSLLKEALQHADSAVSELSLTGTRRALDQSAGWKAPTVDFGSKTVGQHIEDWSRRSPDAVALVMGLHQLSYLEMDRQANRLAHWMRSKGVTAGALVAVELPRSTNLIAAILAAWKVGAAYLPVEPDWPEKRKNDLLNDARPALILRGDQTDPESALAGFNVLAIDLQDFPTSPVGYTPTLSDPAYVLYTSGTTGRPKGVLIGHAQLLNYVAASSAAMRLREIRRWGLCSSIVADLGNTALFGALFNGACLHIASQGEEKDAAAFARFMIEHDIDGLKIAPSHLSALLEHEAPRLPRALILGGEFAPRSLVERILQLAPATSIFNHYGPTETTIGVMIHEIDPTDRLGETLALSVVLANVSVHVLDGKMLPVAPGERGDLYIGGAQLCDGYLNTSASDAFVADPWGSGTRLYRTGDVAAVLPSGGLELVGRADQQVKIRGFRVELGEVESALLAVDGVRQGAVVPHRSGSDVELIAYVVNDQKGNDAATALRQALSATLPQHMLPSKVVFLTELPRLPNGKIDRVALAGMSESNDVCPSDAEYQSPLERFIATAMADLLGRDCVGPNQDFFELGGHSLLVIRLVARIRKHLQAEVDPGLVFDHASARALAAVLPGGAEPKPLETSEVRNEAQ